MRLYSLFLALSLLCATGTLQAQETPLPDSIPTPPLDYGLFFEQLPNTCYDTLYLSHPASGELYIHNLQGVLVLTARLEHTTTVDLSKLRARPGMYRVQIFSEGQFYRWYITVVPKQP